MAQPLQYQSQFVPTDFGTMQNVLGMYRQDMAQRNQEFDKGVAMESSLLSELYGMETYDPEALNQQISSLEGKLSEAVKRKSGDYGAAAQDIARLGAKEMANPIYKLNQRQVEQAKLLEQSIARNPNLKVLRDPRREKLDPRMSPENLEYQVADPANIQKVLNDIYGDLGSQIRQTDYARGERTPAGYLQAQTIKGITEDEYQQMLQDEDVYKAVLARNPQLTEYMEDPEVADWLNTQVQQGLRGLIGGSKSDLIIDRTPETTTGGAGQVGYVPLSQVQTNLIKKSDKPIQKVSQLFEERDENLGIQKEVIKSEVKNRILNSEVNPSFEEDAALIGVLDKQTDGKGLESVLKLSEMSSLLPTPGRALKKTASDVGKIGSFVGAVMGIAIKSFNKDKSIGKSFVNYAKAQEDLKEVEHDPVSDYFKEKKKVYKKFGLDKMDKKSRHQTLEKIKTLDNKINKVGQEVLTENYGDYPKQFVDFNATTGIEELDKNSLAAKKRVNDLIGPGPTRQFRLSNFDILQTDGDDKFKDIEKLRDDKELYSKADKTLSMNGIVVDRNYGVLVELETEDTDGNINFHIATLHDENQARNLLNVFGENNVPVTDEDGRVLTDDNGNIIVTSLKDQYETFRTREQLKSEFGNNLENLPAYKDFKGSTVEEYFRYLDNRTDIPYDKRVRAAHALNSILGLPETAKIK